MTDNDIALLKSATLEDVQNNFEKYRDALEKLAEELVKVFEPVIQVIKEFVKYFAKTVFKVLKKARIYYRSKERPCRLCRKMTRFRYRKKIWFIPLCFEHWFNDDEELKKLLT
jgi:hypothetical protein